MSQPDDFRSKLAAVRAMPPNAERAEQLYLLANNYAEFAGSEAIDICRESLAECEALQLDPLTLTVKRTLGRCLAEQGKATEALKILHEVLPEYEDRHDILGISRTLNIMGSANELTGQFDEALEYFSRALLLHKTDYDPELTAIIQNNIGVVYRKTGDYQSALVFQKKALKIARESGYKYVLARILNSIGAIRTHIKDHEGALQCFMESLEVAQPLRPNMFQLHGLINIGELNILLDRHANALQWLYRAVSKAEERSDTVSLAHARLSLGQAHAGLNNYSGALDDLTEAMRLFTELNASHAQATCLQHIASTLLALDNLDAAARYVEECLRISRERRNVESLAEAGLLRVDIQLRRNELDGLQADIAECRRQARELDRSEMLANICLLEARWYKTQGDENSARRLEREHAKLVREEAAAQKRRKAERALLDAELNAALLNAPSSPRPTGGFALVDDLRETLRDLRKRRLDELEEEKTPQGPKFNVRSLGRFAVEIEGRELSAEDWKRKKARDIFKLLLVNYKQPLSAEFIINAIWGDDGGRNLTPSLWNAVSYLRKALEPGLKPHTPSSYIQINDKTYLLDLGDTAEIDFLQFRDSATSALNLTDVAQKRDHLKDVVELYRGDLLPEDVSEAWSEHLRLSLQEQFITCSCSLAELLRDEGEPQLALPILRNVLAYDDLNPDAFRAMLEIYVDTGQKSEALKLWRQCQQVYQRELNDEPPAELQAIVENA